MKFMKSLKALAAATLLACSSSAVLAAEQTFITIGTGGVTGVYYPAGGAICRLINKDRAQHSLRCSVESTGGAVYNVRAVRNKELNFGMVQSDTQVEALAGIGQFEKDGPYEGLRSIFSLYPEPLHVMVAADSGIKSVQDFKGRRINIGDPGSGTRVLSEILLAANGISKSDLALASELKSSEQAAVLCDGKVEGAIWVAGVPNGAAMEAVSTCPITLLDLSTSAMDEILAANPAFVRVTIPGGVYPGTPEDVVSWGPKATIVTDAETSDEIVYTFVKAVFDNFDSLKKLHPAFENLKEEGMIKDALPAALHPGAVKYYKERGWM